MSQGVGVRLNPGLPLGKDGSSQPASPTMDRLLLAQILICSLTLVAAQRSSFGGLSSFGSFGGFGSGRSTSGWSSWSRSELRSGTIRRLAPLSRGRAPTIDDSLGLTRSAFDSFESAWLKGGRSTDDGYWYTGAQRKRVKNIDDEEEEEEEEDDYYDGEYDGIMEMKEKEKEDIRRQEDDKLWYRGGIESLRVDGQRETSKYRAIAAAKPGVWYEVSQEDQGIAKEPFLRISNDLSRGWDELIASKKAALTPQGARFLGREEAEGRAVAKGPKKGGRRDKGTRKSADLRI